MSPRYFCYNMTNSKFIAFVMYITLLIVFLGLIDMIFDLHRFTFIGEFLILLVLFIIAIIAVLGMHNNFSWAWKLLMLFFVVAFLNMFLINLLLPSKPDLFFPYIVTTIVGFLIAFFSVTKIADKEEEEVTKTFKPGKYIASKSGSKYHAPKCDWAKRIKKSNAVWFDNKKEAKKAGYKADACVK